MDSLQEQVHQLRELIFTVTAECVCVCVHVCDEAICHWVVLCLWTYKASVAEGTDPTPPSHESLPVRGEGSAEPPHWHQRTYHCTCWIMFRWVTQRSSRSNVLSLNSRFSEGTLTETWEDSPSKHQSTFHIWTAVKAIRCFWCIVITLS